MATRSAPLLGVTLTLAGVAALMLAAIGTPALAPEISAVEWLEDGSGTLDAAQVAALPSSRFRPLARPVSAGFGREPCWIRFRLRGVEAEPVHRALVFPYPLVERLDLFLTDAGGGPAPEHRAGGLAVPPGARDVALEGSSHVLRLVVEPGSERVGVLRVATRGPRFLAVGLLTPEAFARRHVLLLVRGAGLGALVLLAVVTLRFALLVPRPNALRFAAVLWAETAWFAVVSGVLAPAWTGPAGLLLALQPVCGGLVVWAGATFLARILGAAQRSTAIDRAMRVVGAAGLATSAAAPFAIATANTAVATLSAAALLLAGAAAALGLRARDPIVLRFAPGLAIYGATAGAYIGADFRLVPPLPVLLPTMMFGFVVACVGAVVAMIAEVGSEVEERQAEALRASEERFRIAFQTSPEPMSLSRLDDGVYVAVNEGVLRLCGLREEEVLGRDPVSLGLWLDAREREEVVAELRRSGSVRGREIRVRGAAGGRIFSYSATVVPIGGVAHVLAVSRDVTEERAAKAQRDQLEEELRQAHKLEAVGRLAAGVAHDFNNLLTAITVNAGTVLDDLPAGDPRRALLGEVLETAGRAAGLTRQLLAFTRRQPHAPRPLALGPLIEDMGRLLGRLVGDEVQLALDLAGDLPAVEADPAQLEQVILNLVVNARDAVRAGGRIVVETRCVELPPREARPGGRYVRLAVRDDGTGMDAATRARIFDPFFTTKDAGRGTGLGLATVYGIVQRHGGFVTVHSEPGAGASFEVHLPALAGAATIAEPQAPCAPPRGRETILVVDDNPPVRDAAGLALRGLGYHVLVAGGGAEALQVAAGHPGAIDLLLSDVRMPGMHGPELAERLAAARPGVRVLFMTGYFGDDLGSDHPGLASPVPKPFTAEELGARVREALEAEAVSRAADR
jgi:PAS domain S-box-containing protein